MPDISMCKEKDCPKARDCYRFRAIPTRGRQSYFLFEEDYDRENCEYHWPLKEGDRILAWPS